MKAIKTILLVVAAIALELFLHIVSFNIFYDIEISHCLMMVVIFLLQLGIINLSYRQDNEIALISLAVVYLVALLYDLWVVVMWFYSFSNMTTSIPVDVLNAIGLVIDCICVVMAYLLYRKLRKAIRGDWSKSG